MLSFRRPDGKTVRTQAWGPQGGGASGCAIVVAPSWMGISRELRAQLGFLSERLVKLGLSWAKGLRGA